VVVPSLPTRGGKSFDRLTGDGGNQLEVGIHVQHDEAGHFCSGGNQQVTPPGPRAGACRQLSLYRKCSLLVNGERYSSGIRSTGACHITVDRRRCGPK
jgi:hypothetical protein